MTSEAPRPLKVRAALRYVPLILWAVSLAVVSSTLMVGHWVVLPVPPKSDPRLMKAVQAMRREPRWQLVHVLYARCACSNRVFDYLFDRGPLDGVTETILLVGNHDGQPELRAREAGFFVENVTREDLQQTFNIASAPLLLVADPSSAIHYVGGYTDRKQGLNYRDQQILRELRAGKATKRLPLFGCGVTRELQGYLDPLGIKYRD